jgi:hypothetical protein
MQLTTLIFSLIFALSLAIVARLTSRRRGPFAFVLRRLRATESQYRSIATTLWVVVIGILGLGIAATVLPHHAESFAQRSVYFFVIAPSMVAAILPTLRHKAP